MRVRRGRWARGKALDHPSGGDSPRNHGGSTAGWPISVTLATIFGIVALCCGALVFLVTSYQQQSSISEMAEAESRRTAQLIFEHLYSVMHAGGGRTEIDEAVDRINHATPDARVSVVRSAQVAEMFGDTDAAAQARAEDPLIRAVLDSGQDQLLDQDEAIRFLHPVLVEPVCMDCHTNTRPGAVNGVVDIMFPTGQLRVPLEFTIRSAIYSFALALLVLFVAVYLKLRWFIVAPIVDLAAHLTSALDSERRDTRIRPSRIWPREVRKLARSFNTLMDDVERAHRRLVDQSTRDALTGLYNRRHFDALMRREVARAERYGRPLTVLMLDLDGFKPVNDTYGHAAGDHLLVHLGQQLELNLRESDVAARLGGDEFAVLASETAVAEGELLAEKLRQIFIESHVDYGDARLSVGCSIGVATFPQDGHDAESLLESADQSMYDDKRRRKAAAGLVRGGGDGDDRTVVPFVKG